MSGRHAPTRYSILDTRYCSTPWPAGRAGDGEQEDCAECGDRDRSPESGTIFDTEEAEEETPDGRTEQADHDVPEAPEPFGPCDEAGQPPCQESHDDPRDDPAGLQTDRQQDRGRHQSYSSVAA